MRYYHTIKYLKPSQLVWRVWYRYYQPKLHIYAVPPIRPTKNQWKLSIAKPNSFKNSSISFLNQAIEKPIDKLWNNQNLEKLWLYNLHYFDWLSSDSDLENNYMHNWVKYNLPAKGVGWEPYPSSLRIVNWIKYFLTQEDITDKEMLMASLASQVRWLCKHIEYHILGNHILANAKALVFAGLFFEGKEAEQWLRKGLSILTLQIPEQILSDGAHFELSPMYHCVILEDFLDLLNIIQAYQSAKTARIEKLIRKRIPLMFSWLKMMTHPDGEISFFNDATLGIAPNYAALKRYADNFSLGDIDSVQHKKASGYYRLENKNAVVILDAGNIGPDYQPGHAHADILSFEMSLHGKRVIVNSGISCYGISSERLWQRSTAAHSTAVVNGKNSSEVWSGFRVAKRARIINVQVDKNKITATAAYLGIRHKRTWLLGEKSLIVKDEFDENSQEVVLNFHLHPGAEHVASNLFWDIGKSSVSIKSNHTVAFNKSTYHDGFNKSQENKLISISSTSQENKFNTIFSWGRKIEK